MKRTKLGLVILAAAALVGASSCAPSLKVTTDYDKSVSFGQYKTFSLYKHTDPTKTLSISQLNVDRIKNDVTSEMQKKGYQLSDNPDLLVNVVTIIQNKKSVSSNTDYYGYGGVYRPYMWGGGMGATGYTTYNVTDYKDGSLIVDVLDAKTKKLIWEGIGNQEIDKPLSDPDTQIAQAVAKILEKFPVVPGTVVPAAKK